jgi:hypothetical protein
MNRYDIIQKRKQDVGRRIRLVNIADAENDPQMRRLIGQTGTIVKVDDSGNYQVDWDNSSSRLSVLIEDTVEFLDEISEGGKKRTKSKRNTVNESGFGNDDIEFVARNVAGHLAGGFRNSSLPKETYNDFIELISNDETRDLFIEDMNIFYHQYFEGKTETDGRRSKMNESRADSFKRNFKSFKNSLNESFNNQELTDAVKDHGGLVTLRGKHNFIGSSDARQNEVSYDLQDAEFRGYIPEDAMEYIYMLDFYKPLNRQLMFCNDGGAIIIEHYPSYSSTGDTPYEAKMRIRNDKFRNEHGYGRYPYTGIDADAAEYRRRQKNGNLSPTEKLYMKGK